jgi:hypothetical protein
MRTRVRAWWAGVDPVVRAAIAVFLVLRLLEVVVSRPTTYPDTPTYRRKGAWLDFSLTSLGGHSVRPWGVTAWMALWPNDKAMIVAQALLSFVAWAALALAVAGLLRTAVVTRIVVAALLLVPCTAQVAGWDLVILGESVSISTAVLALAALLRLVRSPSWRTAALFLAAALWFTMTRPNVFVVLLLWAVAFAVVALHRRQVVLWGSITAVLLAFAGYSYLYNIRSDAAWTERLGYARTTVAFAYPVSQNGPVADAILKDLRTSDAPRCMIPDTPRTVSDHGTTRWVKATVKACPGMDAWATKHWNNWYGSWLLHHPGLTLKVVRVELPNSLSPPVWSGVTAPVPDSVSSLFFGSSPLPQAARDVGTYRTQPLLIWVVAGAVLAVVGGRRRRRTTDEGPDARDERHPGAPVGLVLAATIVGGLMSAISSGLLIQTAPFEVGQESMGALVALTVASVVLVGLGVDGLVGPGRSPAGADHDDVPTEGRGDLEARSGEGLGREGDVDEVPALRRTGAPDPQHQDVDTAER